MEKSRNNLNQFKEGEHIFEGKSCFRIGNAICNQHLDYVLDKESINKRCGACEKTSVCKAYLGNYNSSFNKRR